MNLRDIGILTLDYDQPINIRWVPTSDTFYVEEIRNNKIALINYDNNTLYNKSNSGKFLYFILVKRNISTLGAISYLSNKLGISKKRFRYSGLKDKNATTAQWISVFDPDKKIEYKLRKVRHPFIQIYIIGRENEPISIGDLDGNKFTIKLRFSNTNAIDKFIEFAKNFGIRNYYGLQHFGEGAINLKISRLFIEGVIGLAARELEKNNILHFDSNDYNKVLMENKDLILLIAQSYQKYLFNKLLSKQDINKKDELPVPGFDFLDFNLKEEEEIRQLLEEEGIDYHSLYFPSIPKLSMRTFFRKARFFPKEFTYHVRDDGITLSFILEKGSYASVLMAELTGGNIN